MPNLCKNSIAPENIHENYEEYVFFKLSTHLKEGFFILKCHDFVKLEINYFHINANPAKLMKWDTLYYALGSRFTWIR